MSLSTRAPSSRIRRFRSRGSASSIKTSLVVAVLIVVIGLNLRTLFSSLSAVLPEATQALGLSTAQVLALTVVPVTILGIGGIAAPMAGNS